MAKEDKVQLIKERDVKDLYHHIYTLAQKDYKVFQIRALVRKITSLCLLVLAAAGLFFFSFYFVFLKDRLQDLKYQLEQYGKRLDILNSEVTRPNASELKYREQLEAYENTFSNLKIIDGLVIDLDMTDTVQSSLESIGSSNIPFTNIYRGNTSFKETALTFDLGTGEDLPYIYNILKRMGAKATIFISNEMPEMKYGALFNEKNIDYFIKLAEIGCEFGNHTWSHYNLKRSLYETSKKNRLNLSFVSDEVLDELTLKLEFDRVKNKFYSETGIILSPLWRAPYGAVDNKVLTLAAKAGYPNHVLWSFNRRGPLDFYDYVSRRSYWVKDPKTGRYKKQRNPYYFSSTEMLARLKLWEKSDRNGLSGAISIAHLGTARKNDKIVHILPEYVSYFQNKGYHFVLVSEIINDNEDY
jgi:peptidoglycan/xylan/chitin deacetylase (PgdA/CDA1 family)